MNQRLAGLAAAVIALLLAVAVAPAATVRVQECPRAVVLDFDVAPREVYQRDECRCLLDLEKPLKTEADIRGWWFFSQNVYTNENIGNIAADVISDQLREDGVFEIYSRENLKYYLADKRDILRAKFKNLDDKKVREAVRMLDPVEIGRELGVDYVVLGRICTSEMRHSRAFGYFNSTMSFSVVVVDVRTGCPWFQAPYGGSKGRHSQLTALEEYAQLVSQDIMRLRATGVHPNPRIQQREP
ncbi:MAG: CsgG/HfaB family protein [Candidatus Sumerlaeaceae bacterium]|nr:CsgG/HfaB family protein [Candidatus Sumerlaeaceae bacterium]